MFYVTGTTPIIHVKEKVFYQKKVLQQKLKVKPLKKQDFSKKNKFIKVLCVLTAKKLM
jgi:hypothetical protein